jgi:hypothetical protein
MWRQRLSIWQSLAIGLVALLILSMVWSNQPESYVSQWEQRSNPAAIQGEARPIDRTLIIFDLDSGLYPGEEQALREDLDQALAYVSARFGSNPGQAITAMVKRDDGCGLRGIAYTDIRQAQVFSCNSLPRARAISILAHEFVHQLAQDRYGAAHPGADLILSEGVATWAAGRYWLSGQPSFRQFVRAQRQQGLDFPLATHYAGLGVAGMNALYYQWASFVEYLIDTYGREAFDTLYVSGAGDPGSADYQRVYGKSLNQLEQEWRNWIDTSQ